jgi:uncharacterized protein
MKAGLAAFTLVTMLAGCASAPQVRLHTLMPPPTAAAPAAVRLAAAAPLRYELLSVGLPAQVDQPQWLVRRADDSLVVLEFERWAAPLTDEIRAALVHHIDAGLASTPLPAAAGAGWRISLDITRLDAALGRVSRWDAAWTLQRAGAAQPLLRCRGQFEQPAGTGLAALASAHRANVAKLGEVLAADLRRVAVLPDNARADCTSLP